MNHPNTYVYPAVFHHADDGSSVSSPDLPGCFSAGDTQDDALTMATEALALHLYGMQQDDEVIPEPIHANELQHDMNEIIVLVRVWMPPFRDEMQQRAVKKTPTIPKWLDDLAKEHNVNFSRVLQEGLMQYLGVGDPRQSNSH